MLSKHYSIDEPRINHETITNAKNSDWTFWRGRREKTTKNTRNKRRHKRKAFSSCSSLNLIPLKVNQPFSFHFWPCHRPRRMERRRGWERKIGKQFFAHLFHIKKPTRRFRRCLFNWTKHRNKGKTRKSPHGGLSKDRSPGGGSGALGQGVLLIIVFPQQFIEI